LNGLAPEIHGTGEQSRDFIYVYDTVDAIIKLYDVMQAGDSINISTDGQIKIKDLIIRIAEMMHYSGEILRKEARKSDVECHIADNAKIKQLIKYELTEFGTGLQDTLEWYKSKLL
jgi:UDP-glucose 4-epimerase